MVNTIENEYHLKASPNGLIFWLDGIALTTNVITLWVGSAALEKAVQAAPEGVVIDGDDQLDDGLCATQIKIETVCQKIDRRESAKRLPFGLNVLCKIWLVLFRKAHAHIANARIYIMEHDADCSSLSDDGPFNTVDDLLRSLRA